MRGRGFTLCRLLTDYLEIAVVNTTLNTVIKICTLEKYVYDSVNVTMTTIVEECERISIRKVSLAMWFF